MTDDPASAVSMNMPAGPDFSESGQAATGPAATAPSPAFAAIGIALEHAIVSRSSLDPLPIADQVLAQTGGARTTGVVHSAYGWTKAPAMHLVAVKRSAPTRSLAGQAAGFQREVTAINRLLAAHDARLLPGGMHPWMRPALDTQCWPQAQTGRDQPVDPRIDCQRHGWVNLQGMRLTLPFSSAEECARLHAAIRLVLPIIPALAAASPFADGVDTGFADYRLAVYRDDGNGPSGVASALIPEPLTTRAVQEARALTTGDGATTPHDSTAAHDPHDQHEPQDQSQPAWCDPRGVIALFDRRVIEIRVTDMQECPLADIAVAGAIVAVVRMLYQEETATLERQQGFPSADLADILRRCTARAELAPLTGTACAAYLALLGYPKYTCNAQHLWRYLLRTRAPEPGLGEEGIAAIDQILEHGTLATRLRRATHGDVTPARLHTLYGRLADCLEQGRLFGEQRVM